MAKAQARPIDIEVGEPANADQQLVTPTSTTLRSFLGGLTPFFKTAGELERAAKERLDMARQLKPPTDPASDEKIQLFIREAKNEIKTAEEHWTINAAVHHLHRTLCAARNRVTSKDSKGNPAGMLDQAASIAQQLHNRYVEDENRKARIEQDRLNREAEERARQERERELQQLEEAALKAESQSPQLSEREELFVDATIRLGLRPTAAAERAGFKLPASAGEVLMNRPKIIAALDARKAADAIREQAAAHAKMPVQVETTTVRPNVTKAAGLHDRTTHGAEVTDEAALIVAVLDPMLRTRLGIPADIVTINRAKVNEYGNSLKALINTWPGVRHTQKTSTV